MLPSNRRNKTTKHKETIDILSMRVTTLSFFGFVCLYKYTCLFGNWKPGNGAAIYGDVICREQHIGTNYYYVSISIFPRAWQHHPPLLPGVGKVALYPLMA